MVQTTTDGEDPYTDGILSRFREESDSIDTDTPVVVSFDHRQADTPTVQTGTVDNVKTHPTAKSVVWELFVDLDDGARLRVNDDGAAEYSYRHTDNVPYQSQPAGEIVDIQFFDGEPAVYNDGKLSQFQNPRPHNGDRVAMSFKTNASGHETRVGAFGTVESFCPEASLSNDDYIVVETPDRRLVVDEDGTVSTSGDDGSHHKRRIGQVDQIEIAQPDGTGFIWCSDTKTSAND